MIPRGRIVVNVLSNWGGQVFAVLLSFFVAPFIVHRLGDAAYGVWILVVAIAGYMGLLDLGVRGAVTRYVAGFSADGRDGEAGRIASAALQIFLATGAACVFVSILLALFALDHLSIPVEHHRPAQLILVLSGLNVGVSLVSGVYAGVIAARQRFDLLNLVDVAAAGVRTAGFVVALQYGQGLVVMAAIQLLVSLLRGVWLFNLSRRTYQALRIQLGLAEHQYIRTIFSFSVISFLIHISGRVIYYTDAIIIGTFLPIGMLTIFSIGGSLVEHARSLISSISYTTSPLASSLDAVGQNERVQRVLLETGRFSNMILLPIGVTFLIRGESFVGLWMGQEYAASAGQILAILTLPLLLHGGTHGLGGIMMGVGKHRRMMVAMIGEGIANLALSVALVRPLGIAGVAWGTTIPSLVWSLVFWPWYLQRALDIRPGQYFITIWGSPVVAVIPFGICTYLIEQVWPAHSMAMFAVQVGVCVLVVVATDWWVCFNRQQRNEIVAAVRQRIASPAPASVG